MNVQAIERQFARIGARARIRDLADLRRPVRVDIGRDGEGEFFDVAVSHRTAEIQVVDTEPHLRHLLLLSRQEDGKHKFLCGHDERHWFVAAIPERASVSTVETAFEALKPTAVHIAVARTHVRRKNRNRRRNEAFLRQGEWFFVPVASGTIPEMLILRNEPLRRGSGKPHVCEELVRTGGTTVYVSAQFPDGLTEVEFRALISRRPRMRNLQWVTQRRNPGVFVRGRIRHSDHKTIVLNGWHRVVMNTETEAAAMRHVAFID